MPAKVDNQTIGDPFLDRRTKLLPCQKEMVVWWSKNKSLSSRQLAAMFNISRRTIQFILDPEKLIKNKEARNARGGSKVYYDRTENSESMRKHRAYKKKILK